MLSGGETRQGFTGGLAEIRIESSSTAGYVTLSAAFTSRGEKHMRSLLV